MIKPRILLTNDDGVTSEGLWATYEALSTLADVTVCAPSTQQSAAGRSMTIFEPLRVNEVYHEGILAYSVRGKPTDALLTGLYALNLQPDLVVSGINIGENVSFEAITTSGTVGAALEAANQGIPSVAFSLMVDDQKEKFADCHRFGDRFETSKKVIIFVISQILKNGFPDNCHVVNVNIPAEFTGDYKITHLAEHLFNTSIEKRIDPRGKPYYWISGPLVTDAEEGTDVNAIHHGNVSITPLTLDCTSYAGMASIKKLFCDKLDE